jgi:hypothetical protein
MLLLKVSSGIEIFSPNSNSSIKEFIESKVEVQSTEAYSPYELDINNLLIKILQVWLSS